MPNPYVQVALTYPRHIGASGIWGFVTAAMMLIAFVFLGTMIARSDEHHNGMLWLIIVMSSLGLWQTIVAHAREQFADSRSHLMPNFRDAHFAAFAALALMVVLLVPVTFTWLVGLRSIVPVAVSVFLCGATLPQPRWLKTVLSASGWGVFLLFIAIANYWPYWPQQLFSGELISSGQLECPALIVLVLGAAMAVSGGRWLARMNEDMPDYHLTIERERTPSRQSTEPREIDVGIFRGRLRDWLAERQVAGLAWHARRAGTSRWSRACRWQAGMTTGWSIWFWSLGLILGLQAWEWFVRRGAPGQESWGFIGFLLMFFPIGKSVARWDQRTPTLARELLMPVTRSAYLRQLGGAAALNQLQLWAAMSTVAVACVLVTGNDGPPLATILDLLVISGLSQIWLFGVAVWWTRCQSCLLGLLVGLVAIFEPIVLIGMLWGGLPAEWRYATWFVAGLFALFGLLLMRNAYRRWWWTELDCVRT